MNATELKECLKKTSVTVCSIWSKDDPYSQPVIYSISIPRQGTDCETLELAFRETNRVDGREIISKLAIRAPSTSCGDLMIWDGRFWFVDSHGFVEITEPQYDAIRTNLTSRETGWGWSETLKALEALKP